MELTEEIYTRFDTLIDKCRLSSDEKGIELVNKAFQYSKNILGDNKFPTGEYIINHALDVATVIAVEIGLGIDSVVAGLLHNVKYAGLDKQADTQTIIDKFGETVWSILDGMAKINALGTDTVDLHSENYRKLLLAMAGDVRVIIVKIADRLQVMRNLDNCDKETQNRIANETSHLYAPLAHRLGLYNVNSELLDICLKYQKPDKYHLVLDRLKESETERENFVAEFVKPIESKLNSRGFKFNMKARTKSIHSIWNKMKGKKVSFDEVLDLFAIRVILESKPENEKSDCWTAYSIVTEEYQTNPERLRDWITIPKSNGYESLHTTVMGPQGKWVEIQIRTHRMDEVAEKGLAAHWKYKGGVGGKEFDNWLMGIRDILENPDLNITDFIDEFRIDAYQDEIFVFTPKGDLKKLSAGATMLDFAYEIHSDLGDKCVGGNVNGKKVTLKYKLKNGDHVSIDTLNNQKPKLDWLDFVKSTKAKNRIKARLNEDRNADIDDGKEIIARKFKNWKITLNDDAIRKMIKHFGFKLAVDLYYNVSIGKIDPLEIKSLFVEKEFENSKEIIEDVFSKDAIKDLAFDSGEDYLIIDKNLNNVIYKLSQCCNPVLGDDIFGFVTINEGIKIHRRSCPNAPQMIERYPYRLIKARWKQNILKSSFLASLFVSGTDHIGIVSEISHVIAKDIGVQTRSLNVETNNGLFEGTFKIMVYDLNHLDFLIQKLKNVKGVTSVTRGD